MHLLLCLAAQTGCGGGAPIGTVDYGDLVYRGDLDGEFFSRQLIQLDPPFQACYVRAKRQDRSTEGVIELILRGGNGSITGEITSNTTGSAELGDCVLGAISGLRIIEPEESAPWDYTAEWTVIFELARSDRESN